MNTDNYFPSRNKEVFWINQPKEKDTSQTIYSTHTQTNIDQCGMRKKTTDKHTEANYNSRMK
jgi:hypothetical protein